MTAKVVVFDAWAWHEVLAASDTGAKLRRKYLEHPDVRILTVDITLAELSAKLARIGQARSIAEALDAVIQASHEIVPVTLAEAVPVGPVLVELRKRARDASLVDATLLCAARSREATLISGDAAFEGLREVRRD